MNTMTIQRRVEQVRELLLMQPANVPRAGFPPVPGFKRETLVDLFISKSILHARHEDDEVDAWITTQRQASRLHAKPVPLDQVDHWGIDPATGNIRHESGRFFTITGLKVRHRMRDGEIEWDQPMIDQPEVGILGIMAAKIDGILHFCLQAKEEPGNIGAIQLSPTVQATYSNYTRAHGGALPPFVSLFLDPPPDLMLYAKLQTEDGGRFLYKSNRNMIVMLDDLSSLELPDGFIWLTLRQIRLLMQRHCLVNACARSVLSCLV
jgi:oxidase EvaA